MMDRQKGKFFFECDGCRDVLDTETGDFLRANEDRKSAGWSAKRKDDGEYEHYCPRCQ